ncbi:hypothetical protein [Nocardia sp. NBC_01329]|uniref:hypothetical protein n=1 Tax=Nocardia sp. NBC_01329 TaxID=2903594 RepID=UPI002E14FC03|nr:hypothetical protein OG405_03175 [Nocardia sp. NBC_01329]
MMKRIRSTVLGIAAVCMAVGGAPAVSAAPSDQGDALCEFTYPTPDDTTIGGSSATFAAPAGPGAATFTMLTDAGTETSYEQKFNLIWANLDTGRNGGAEVVAKVYGPDNVLSIPAVRTEPGRIALVLQAFNHGNDENRSFGDCSAEYTVV